MLSLSLPLLVAITCASPPDQPAELQPTADQVRRTVEASTVFLEKEGIGWMKKQQCVSCHHVPFMVWALNEARNRGYTVNEQAVAEVTTWALAEENRDEVFPDLPLDKKRTETDYLGPLLMALGAEAGNDRDRSLEKSLRGLLARAVSQQAKDGSWYANSGGRPPVHASKDVQTSWLLLAISHPIRARAAEDPWKVQREAAIEWLAHNPPADNTQALAMRVLVHERLGRPSVDTGPLVESLLKQQNDDGGWSQTKEMKSDAYATGLALYVLSGQKAKGLDVTVRRAQVFLVDTQQPDGSWLMTSRRAEPTGPGPARDLRPIKVVGTAWGTIGLVRSCPGRVCGRP
jgi:hypothetical protein